MIRVLIVEDSVTQREIFRRLLAADEELLIVGEARDGKDALEKVLQCRPDVVLMDIHMPDMDGIAATAEIMRECPVPIVVASATLKKRDVDLAMQAYEAGAVSVIEKPEGAVLLHLQKMGPELRNELIAAASSKICRIGRPRSGPAKVELITPVDRTRPATKQRITVLGVCASTGGPPVLLEIFKAIPKPFPIPVLLVQHISRGFEDGFARWLSRSSGQSVGIAVDGQPMTPGVWMSLGGQHLQFRSDRRWELVKGLDSEIHCPSGNPMFRSLVQLGPQAAGVLLTGMGDDGAQGLLELKQSGGRTIIQNEASCLIWGMPKIAQQLGAADYELSPSDIATALVRLVF